MVSDDDIKKIVDSFYSFDDFYSDLKNADWDIQKTRAANEPWMIQWTMNYLIREEKFEQAAELKKAAELKNYVIDNMNW